ncbi:MAG: nuclear transport factor 2 family protein [Nannocystaceae bacterium]|nr:nuclear transport factor 2 family protein [Nannocystaceae bacterium]
MTTTQEIVTAFYSRIEARDFDSLRSMLHDDLDFEGPVEGSDSADAFVAAVAKMSSLTEGFDVLHLFVDGERACCVFDLVTATPIGNSPVAEYFQVRDGRIASIRSHYDSRPWLALTGSGSN